MKPTIERSLVLLKPDSFFRGNWLDILMIFLKMGYTIVNVKMVNPSLQPAGVEGKLRNHYAKLGEKAGEEVLGKVLHYMMSGPFIAAIIEGHNAIQGIHDLCGATEPANAAPGTIRAMFCPAMKLENTNGLALHNVVHSSDNEPGSAEEEIKIWFTPDEIPPLCSVRTATSYVETYLAFVRGK